MKFNKKLILIITIFFVIHFLLQFGFLFVGFAAGMQSFDNPDDENLKIKSEIYWKVYNILSFPLLFITDRIRFLDSVLFGLLSYIPFILNSALWSLGFYFLI